MPLQKLGGKEYYLGIFFKVKIIIFLLNVKPYTQKQRWEKWHFCRLTGTRRSSTAGSTACTWPASTARRNSASWRWGNRVNKILNLEAWTRPIPIYTFNSNGHTQYLPFSGAHHGLRDGERALLEQRHGPGRGGQVSHCRWVRRRWRWRNVIDQIIYRFVWMATGKPLTYENWNAGEPNNFQ